MPKNREQLKQEYIDSLDSFISQNPTVGQLDTAKFRDFLIGLVERESSFNPTARQGSYFGWYQTNKLDSDPYNQHMNAFNHLNRLFNTTITKNDIKKARSLGINDSALMLKYWNQGNRVNNYLWNNKDSADGLGTLISKYGSDLTMPLDVYDYALDNIYGNYTVKEGDNWFNIQKRVRMPGRDYTTGGKDLWNMQQLAGRPYGSLKIGQSFTFGEPNILVRKPIRKLERLFPRRYYHYPDRVENTKPETIKYDIGGELIYKPFIDNKLDEDEYNENFVYKPFIDNQEIFPFINNYIPRFPVEPVNYSAPFNTKITTVETSNKPSIQKESKQTETAIQDVNNIQSVENSDVKMGTVSYARKGIDVGKMQEWIDLAIKEGISFTIYSGLRPNAITKSGNKSNHALGTALDIGPAKGQTFADLKKQILASSKLIEFMKKNKIGILNETIPEVMRQTGATGPHFHIGPDSWALQHFERWLRNERENTTKL